MPVLLRNFCFAGITAAQGCAAGIQSRKWLNTGVVLALRDRLGGIEKLALPDEQLVNQLFNVIDKLLNLGRVNQGIPASCSGIGNSFIPGF